MMMSYFILKPIEDYTRISRGYDHTSRMSWQPVATTVQYGTVPKRSGVLVPLSVVARKSEKRLENTRRISGSIIVPVCPRSGANSLLKSICIRRSSSCLRNAMIRVRTAFALVLLPPAVMVSSAQLVGILLVQDPTYRPAVWR